VSIVYRSVDFVLSTNAEGEVREGDRLLLDTGRPPREGELALVRRDGVESLCRWGAGCGGDVQAVVIGIKRKL